MKFSGFFQKWYFVLGNSLKQLTFGGWWILESNHPKNVRKTCRRWNWDLMLQREAVKRRGAATKEWLTSCHRWKRFNTYWFFWFQSGGDVLMLCAFNHMLFVDDLTLPGCSQQSGTSSNEVMLESCRVGQLPPPWCIVGCGPKWSPNCLVSKQWYRLIRHIKLYNCITASLTHRSSKSWIDPGYSWQSVHGKNEKQSAHQLLTLRTYSSEKGRPQTVPHVFCCRHLVGETSKRVRFQAGRIGYIATFWHLLGFCQDAQTCCIASVCPFLIFGFDWQLQESDKGIYD